MKTENRIVDLSFEFALMIIELTEKLEKNRKFVVANQLFKAGTSIGANIRESQSAESRADFIHKLKIAAKEAEEVDYWLELCKRAKNYDYEPIYHEKLLEIRKLLSSIISTTKARS
jgi:four helix bundle protein